MSEIEPTRGRSPARASDADRTAALAVLRDQCGAGTLTLDEFSDRCGLVLAAQDRGELAALMSDLPSLAGSDAARVDVSVSRVVAFFGSNRRRARWRVGKNARAIAVGGAAWMDLRQAQLTGGELTIRALAILGTVKVIVPDGIAVELTGMSIFGATTDRSHVEPHLVGAPVIRVKAWPIFGSVRILNQAPPGSLE